MSEFATALQMMAPTAEPAGKPAAAIAPLAEAPVAPAPETAPACDGDEIGALVATVDHWAEAAPQPADAGTAVDDLVATFQEWVAAGAILPAAIGEPDDRSCALTPCEVADLVENQWAAKWNPGRRPAVQPARAQDAPPAQRPLASRHDGAAGDATGLAEETAAWASLAERLGIGAEPGADDSVRPAPAQFGPPLPDIAENSSRAPQFFDAA